MTLEQEPSVENQRFREEGVSPTHPPQNKSNLPHENFMDKREPREKKG
jgi:hypothetical protein